MRKLTIGIATAAVLLCAATAMAQVGLAQVGFRAVGFGVEVGAPHGAYHHAKYRYRHDHPYRRHYRYYGPPAPPAAPDLPSWYGHTQYQHYLPGS